METKWASLIPFAKVADLLKEVLPIGHSVHRETVRKHMQAMAERIEQELGEERQLNQYEGSENEWEQQPLPDGPITVGIDGGYVRAAHKQGCFEVIAGKSVVAFRREDETETPSAKCFGFVQTYDEKPRRRLWELLKSQGMQENQQVVFMSDGGEDVRRVQQYLHPFSEHLLDWFHITMRLTVLQQQTKGLQQERPAIGVGIAKQLESIKHFLLARKHSRSDGTADRPLHRSEHDPGAFSSRRKDRAGSGRLRDLHQEQQRVHSQLRRSMAAGRKDQYGVRRIDDQSGCEQEVREKTTDAVDATRTSSLAPGEDQGAQQ